MNHLFFALLFACCTYAFFSGGKPERLGAALYAGACIASFLIYSIFSAPSTRFRSVEVGIFIVDIMLFVAFTLLAVRANRFWPIWASALLGLGVLGHLARWAGPDVIPWAYAAILSIWSYPIMAIIAIGTFNHRRQIGHGHADEPWAPSSRMAD